MAKLESYPSLIVKYFKLIDSYIKSLGDIVLKENTTMMTYRHKSIKKGNSVVWIQPDKKTIRIILSKGPKYPDNFDKINPDGFGHYPEIIFESDELEKHFDYIKKLLTLSYQNICDK